MDISTSCEIEEILAESGACELVSSHHLPEPVGFARHWVAIITPEMAERMLRHNTKNRKKMETHVEALAQVFSDGDWRYNGASIRIGTDGIILDGQHRLTACVESGESFCTLVVTSLDPDVFSSIDTGQRTRVAGQVLALEGEPLGGRIAATIRALAIFCKTGGTNMEGGATPAMCPEKVCRILRRHPSIRESVVAMNATRHYSTGVSAMLHFMFSRSSPRLAKEFAEVLHRGSSELDRPFNMFREAILKPSPGMQHSTRRTAAKAIKAFAAEYDRRRPKNLSWRIDESFPMIPGIDYDRLMSIVDD